MLPMLVGDWNEECMGNSNSKKLCNKFGLVNIFHGKYLNHEKFKTDKDGYTFIDYNCIHQDLNDKVDQVTYESFGYQNGKGDHRGSYLDILETNLFGNKIDGVYQTQGRILYSKDTKQTSVYLKAVNKHLSENEIYRRINKLVKSKRSNQSEVEAINKAIKYSTRYSEQ